MNWRVGFVAPDESADDPEVAKPIAQLEETGARVERIGDGRSLDAARLSDYDAIALPAALLPDDCLHMGAKLRKLLQCVVEQGKPIVWLPVSAPLEARGSRRRHINLKRLVAESWDNWNANDATRMAAALAYYTVFSLAPLLVLTVAIAGMIFERTKVQNALLSQIYMLMGSQGASMAKAVLANVQQPAVGALELRDSLNTVWGVTPGYGSGLVSLVRARFSAFLVVIALGLAACFTLLASALVASPARFVMQIMPERVYLLALADFTLSFGGMTLLFAAVYKFIPDIRISWGDVWIGALVTAALFSIGKALIGLYLGHVSVGSAYAAAGSLAVFLAWVYYSAQIFLLGAEFTHVYALRRGTYSNPRSARRRQY